jgi:predicted metal-dependent HD superfamily phosphohydrolase
MKINSGIVKQAAEHVTSMLNEKLPANYFYHNLIHTQNVVEAVKEMADAMRLPDHGKKILIVAAWFHDIGYIQQESDHETIAADVAAAFLKEREADEDDIRQVKDCILATRYPQNPSSLLEQIICDADMLHLGKKGYYERAILIREEWALTKGESFSDRQWYELNMQFLNDHRFHTAYCNDSYSKRKNKNLMLMSALLDELDEKPAIIEKGKGKIKGEKAPKKEKEPVLPRGVETLFRSASSNHMRLSGMADNKAHILLSINSIIISIILSVLAKKLIEAPYLVLPTILLLVVSVTSIVFAVLTTRPKVSKGVFTKEQISNREANLLFFGNFHRIDLSTYEWGIREMMYDKEYLYKSMTKDIYFMGKVLAVKYRFLNIGYLVFMFGMIASIVSFAISFLMN